MSVHLVRDGVRLEIVLGDITEQAVEVIVNAANSSLLGGGGVDGAIHRAAGPGLLEECRTLGGCPTGEARITRGHGLKAAHVAHAVGPRWRGGGHGEPDLLRSCYVHALDLAERAGGGAVAFPAISCGVYGYPVEQAARVSVGAVVGWLGQTRRAVRLVRWVLYSEEVYTVWRAAMVEAGAEVSAD